MCASKSWVQNSLCEVNIYGFYKSCELIIMNLLIIYSHVYDFDKQLLTFIYLTEMYLYI